ncbi:MAG: hypothetical protein ABI591_00925 [Kofleriaceae bacterium]
MVKLVTSLAHPGHGTTDPSSLRHYLTEPLHVVALVAVLAVTIELVLWLVKRRESASRT